MLFWKTPALVINIDYIKGFLSVNVVIQADKLQSANLKHWCVQLSARFDYYCTFQKCLFLRRYKSVDIENLVISVTCLYLQFPAMEGSIFGEESNLFTNTLGETKIIQMCPEPEQTKQLLCKIFLSDSFFFLQEKVIVFMLL